jgi:SAM-dependent methyltransferase
VLGFGPHSYGEAFADVYDEWYAEISPVEATVARLRALAGAGPVLELGVGTGRLALPLAATGLDVHGVDASPSMLERLRAKQDSIRLDAGARPVRAVLGDMIEGLPAGPFTLVFAAFNTLFNVRTAAEQEACFAAVASRLAPGGRFVVEAFVPDDPPRSGSSVEVRELAVDRVVLSVSRYDAGEQTAEGQFVELTEGRGVRLRPWAVRWATPAQLDAMASAAGLTREARWSDWVDGTFTADSDRHVTVYMLAPRTGRSALV